jgi:NAD(P)-dependent dehydrogenase (short-subunit alcohol dehydrogenase family)
VSTASQTLAGRHAIVTGASRGIGAAIASSLAAQGAQVSLFARDEAKLVELSEKLGGSRHAAAITADVTQTESVRAAFATACERFGAPHILVNNAGQAASARLADTDDELWNRLMAVNVTGVFLCTRQAVPHMVKQNFGRIINIASTAGLRGAAYISAYAASKHAVIGLTKSLALELATKGITVNAVCPGYTDTDIVTRAVTNISSKTGRSQDEALETLLATNPQHRLITPQEVAHTVIWLCTPGTESITGQSIVLAGGEV